MADGVRRCAALLLACLLWLPLLATATAPIDLPTPPRAGATGASSDDAAPAAQAPRIGLLTMSPGTEYWSRFGHNAILVVPADGPALVYNYGYFDFEQPGFMTRFLRGRMLYKLLALPLEQDLGYYAAEGRGVTLQWLDVTPERAHKTADFLAWNARPENADYRYDYFEANCSTKVRDALDLAFDGELKRALEPRSRGLTARSEALRLASSLPWLYLGIHLGLGPPTDRPLSRWQEGFVPERLHDAIAELTLADGRPAVIAEQRALPARVAPAPAQPPRWTWRFAAVGVATALALAAATGSRRRWLRWLGAGGAAVFWLACGLIGCGLLALWAFTDHAAAAANWNALLCNPLCLLLLAGVPRLLRGEACTPVVRMLSTLVLLCCAAAALALAVAVRGQDIAAWLVLLVPIHAALAWRLRAPLPPGH